MTVNAFTAFYGALILYAVMKVLFSIFEEL